MKGSHILVVEDESIVALDLKNCLEQLGYHVTAVVNSGETAVETVNTRHRELDLILMDVRLQGKMNGIEAARIIQAHHDIPVVYLTAYTDDKTLEQATATGPYGYLVKPFEERELKTTIEVVLFKHKMERELKESQERFREIFRQNSDAIVLLKRSNFEIIDINPAAQWVLQYTPGELKDFGMVFHNQETYDLFKQEICDFQDRKEKDGAFSDRCKLHTREGKTIICSVQVSLIKLQEDDVFYCVFRDITEKIKMEAESRTLQAKLIQANRMTSLGTLASGLAHEINNPNNFIMSNTQIIQQVWHDTVTILNGYYEKNGDFSLGGLEYNEVAEVVPQLLQATIEGARRIKHITDTLKEYSRPKNEVLGTVDINKVLEFSTSILNNQIRKSTRDFAFEPGTNIPGFRGNSRQIEQVMINLIQNALQALPNMDHGVRVTSLHNKTDQSVVVRIRDQGTGIDKAILDRITEPFFTTRQDQGGTGLGLYISYSIIKAHRGTLDFESRPGHGTTAVVKIPLFPKGNGDTLNEGEPQ